MKTRAYTGSLAVFLVMMVMSSSPVMAQQPLMTRYTWGDKLTRGAVNIVTSPVEIPRTVTVVSNREGAGMGWTVGLVQGLGRMLWRAGTGVVEVVTFPFEWPEENRAPIMEPRYAWEDWGRETF